MGAQSNFPTSLDTTSQFPADISATAALNSPNHAEMHERYNDAIIEIEEKIGIGNTTPTANAFLVGDGTGESDWTTTPTFKGAVTVGVDGTGHDVKFYGDTAGSYMLWDESAGSLHVSQQVTSSSLADFTQALSRASIKLIGDYTDGHYQGAILWSTDDDNATKPKAGIWVKTTSSGSQLEFGTSGTYGTGITNTALSIGSDGTVTVGSDGSGHDVVFYSGTAGDNLTWDASEECLIITGTAGQLALDVAAGTVEFNGNFNVGTDGSGHDVRFYSATAGDSFHWDASDEILKITGTHGQNALSVLDGNVYIADGLDVDGSCSLDSLILEGNLAFTGALSGGTSSIPRVAYRASGGAASVASYQLDANPTIFINPAANAPSATAAGDIWFGV